MKLLTYITPRGVQAKLAKELGVPQVSIHNWAYEKRPIPTQHCAAIERATNGVVTRRDLRPDDWHLIWPELVEKDAA